MATTSNTAVSQQNAVSFRQATRQIVQLVGSSAGTLGGTPTTLQLPQAGWLGRLYVDLQGTVTPPSTYTTGNYPSYPLLPWSMINRFKLMLNASNTDLFDVSGMGLYWLNMFRRRNYSPSKEIYTSSTDSNAAGLIQLAPATPVASTAAPVAGQFVLDVMTDDSLMLGMLFLQSASLQATLNLTPAVSSSVVGGVTGATGAYTATVTSESFEQPGGSNPPLPNNQWAKITTESVVPITASGETDINLPSANLYMRVLLVVEDSSGNPATLANLTQVGVSYAQMVSPYNEPYRNHLARNRAAYGRMLPAGLVMFDWSSGAGIPGILEGRDLINSMTVTNLKLQVWTSMSSGNIRVITEQLAQRGQ
jgi:hypothetical protein